MFVSPFRDRVQVRPSRLLLQAFDHVEIGESADIAVHVGPGIRGEGYSPDGVDSGCVGGHQLLPKFSFSSGQLQLEHFGGNLSKAEDVERAAIRGPARWRLVGFSAGDRNGFTAGDGIKINLVVRADTGREITLWGKHHRRVHAFRADGAWLGFAGRRHIETESVSSLVTRKYQLFSVGQPTPVKVVHRVIAEGLGFADPSREQKQWRGSSSGS